MTDGNPTRATDVACLGVVVGEDAGDAEDAVRLQTQTSRDGSLGGVAIGPTGF